MPSSISRGVGTDVEQTNTSNTLSPRATETSTIVENTRVKAPTEAPVQASTIEPLSKHRFPEAIITFDLLLEVGRLHFGQPHLAP